MNRQFLIQQILSIMEITPYKLGKKTHLSRSTISRWLRGTSTMDNGSVYQLNYYLKNNELISAMLKRVIGEIEQ